MNAVCHARDSYLQIVVIETDYDYYAPKFAASYKLVFELHYPVGQVEYELPPVSSAAAGLRIAGLLDKIGRTHYEALRERLVKMAAKSIWQEHPEVKAIRAVFGSISLPSISEFEHGRRESYECLYAYDFSRHEEPAEPKRP